jgi:hypothetical protein
MRLLRMQTETLAATHAIESHSQRGTSQLNVLSHIDSSITSQAPAQKIREASESPSIQQTPASSEKKMLIVAVMSHWQAVDLRNRHRLVHRHVSDQVRYLSDLSLFHNIAAKWLDLKSGASNAAATRDALQNFFLLTLF